MKVVSSKQMVDLEAQAYRDGVSSEVEFMEEAGSGVALVVHEFVERHQLNHHVILLCGSGNNGGDAYVAGIHLIHLDYEVLAFQLFPNRTPSSLCEKNRSRFIQEGGRVFEISSVEQIAFPVNGIIIDGIFGTGFHGEIDEVSALIMSFANRSRLPIISVDIPSGLNGETGESVEETIQASETAFLGLPKTGFFLRDGWDKVGKLRYVDYGLPQEYIDASESDLTMLTPQLVQPWIPPLKRSRHKYEAGYVVGLAGSVEMPGAALLSSEAALRSGAGIVRLLFPHEMRQELIASPYEMLRTGYDPLVPEEVIEVMQKANAVFIGPGMGRSDRTRALIKAVLKKIDKPLVLDADALFFLAEEKMDLPQQCILTPHHGEMQRLLGNHPLMPLTSESLKKCQAYAEEKGVTLVLKGGPTFIFQPNEPVYVNPTGDPGMATAGTGDVLTGIIAALLAQGIPAHQAAALGVYLHGLAGEHAAANETPWCMTAYDLLTFLPDAFAFRVF